METRALHRSTTCEVHLLSELLIPVDDGSVQLVSSRQRQYIKLNTCAVTHVLATTPSPIDASLAPSVNRCSVGSYLYKTSLSIHSTIRQTRDPSKQTSVRCATTDEKFCIFVSGILKE